MNLVKWLQLNFPELVKAMHNSSHHFDAENINPYHMEGDVWTHTMMVYNESLKVSIHEWPVMGVTALLHDVGKPKSAKKNKDTKRVSFSGHAGMSVYQSINILRKLRAEDILSKIDYDRIICVIAWHFDWFQLEQSKPKNTNIFNEMDRRLLSDINIFSAFDDKGRISDDNSLESADARNEKFTDVVENLPDAITFDTTKPTCTILIGPPACGKSTWIKQNNVENVLSRDNIVMSFAEDGETYSDAWKKADQKEVDRLLLEQRKGYVNRLIDFTIDMTNMGRKARAKHINALNGFYNVKAVMIVEDYTEIKKRQAERNAVGDKVIPPMVISQMIKSLQFPVYGEGFYDIEIYDRVGV